MGESTKIEWARHTFNPWRGCTKVSPGCAHCYAERQAKRNPRVLGEWGPGARRARASEDYLKQLLRWDRSAQGAAERPRVFIGSLMDWLDPEIPTEWRVDLFHRIWQVRNLDLLLLTKRPGLFGPLMLAAIGNDLLSERFGKEFNDWLTGWVRGRAPGNVWVGTSVEDQRRANARIPELLKIPAVVRFLSCEPLLGQLIFDYAVPGCYTSDWSPKVLPMGIHWVIVGGESGPGARPCDVGWIRNVVGQCRVAEVPVFVKQLGSNSYVESLSPPKGREMGCFANSIVIEATRGSGKWKPCSMKHPKGGDMAEWPEDLRVRELP